MARWIDQTLRVDQDAQIILLSDRVIIEVGDNQGWDGFATFKPKSPDDAMAMGISLRLAAKRLEDIGKGLS